MQIKDEILNLSNQRKAAKVGMGVTLSITALTSLNSRGRKKRNIHKYAGWALVACSIWHASLYGTKYAKYLAKSSKNEEDEA